MLGFDALGVLALGEALPSAAQIAVMVRRPADDRATKRRQIIYLAPPQTRPAVLEAVREEIEAERAEAKRKAREARAQVKALKARERAKTDAAEDAALMAEALAFAERQRLEAALAYQALEAELNFIIDEIARLELEAKRRRDEEAMAVLMLSAI